MESVVEGHRLRLKRLIILDDHREKQRGYSDQNTGGNTRHDDQVVDILLSVRRKEFLEHVYLAKEHKGIYDCEAEIYSESGVILV